MMCQEKKKYRNLFIAEWAMDDVKSRYGETKTPYLCQECNAYHLTSNNPNYKRSFPVNTIMPQGRVSLIIRHNKYLMTENMALEAKVEELQKKYDTLYHKHNELVLVKVGKKGQKRAVQFLKTRELIHKYIAWCNSEKNNKI